HAGGVPRMVNLIADGCLLAAYRARITEVSADAVKEFWTAYLETREGRTWPPVPTDELVLRPLPPPTVVVLPAEPPTPVPARETRRREMPATRAPREGMLPAPTRYVAVDDRKAPRGRRIAAGLGGVLVGALAVAIAWREYPQIRLHATSSAPA